MRVFVPRCVVPSVRFPQQGFGKVFIHSARGPGGGEERVRGGNHVGSAFDGHGGFDFAENGVDGGVDAERLSDDLAEEGEFGEIFVADIFDGAVGIDTENVLLLLDELVLNVGAGGEAEKDP